MPTFLFINGDPYSNEFGYGETMDYLYNEYHIHSPYTPDVYVDEELMGEHGFYEQLALSEVEEG